MHKTIVPIFACSILSVQVLMTAACRDEPRRAEQGTEPVSQPGTPQAQTRQQDLPSPEEARALIESSDRVAKGHPISYDISFDQVNCLAELGIFASGGHSLQGRSIDLTAEGRKYLSSDGPIRTGPYNPQPRATLYLAPALQPNPPFKDLTIDKVAPPRTVMETVTVSFRVDLNEPSLPEKIASCLPPIQTRWSGYASLARDGGAWQITYVGWITNPGK